MNIVSHFLQKVKSSSTDKSEKTQKVQLYNAEGKPINHIFTDAEREKSNEIKRIKAEVRRRKELRMAYLDKLQDEVEMAKYKRALIDLADEGQEESTLDKMFTSAMEKLIFKQGLDSNTDMGVSVKGSATDDYDNFSADVEHTANTFEVEGEEDDSHSAPSTRFTDEQVKANLSKILNPQQVEMLKNLSEEEIRQIYRVISQQ